MEARRIRSLFPEHTVALYHKFSQIRQTESSILLISLELEIPISVQMRDFESLSLAQTLAPPFLSCVCLSDQSFAEHIPRTPSFEPVANRMVK